MKIACIALNSNMLAITEQSKIIDYIKVKLYEIGESISSISYFDNSLNNLKSNNLTSFDLVFIIGQTSAVYNYNIKENLAQLFSTNLVQDDTCYSALNKYCFDNNIPFSMLEEMEIKIPTNSIPLVCDNMYNNGFMYKANNTYIAFLPSNFDFVEFNLNNYILPFVKDLSTNKTEFVVLKCFGILEKDIRNYINEFITDKNINIQITGDDLDSAIYIKYDANIDKGYIQNIISEICTKLNKFIYATEDIDIYKLACNLLNLRGRKLSIAETITYGNINRELSLNDANCICDAFIFNNYDGITKNLNIDKRVLDKYGHYSVNTVYELANVMLEKTKAEIALFLLGDKNNDLCYIAIGDINGIHVYKSKINNRNTNTISNLSKTAIFYLIKKLKQNDLLM